MLFLIETFHSALEGPTVKGMVHLIHKSHIKAELLCAKYDDAISFDQNNFWCLHKVGLKLQKNKGEIPNKLPDDPNKDA